MPGTTPGQRQAPGGGFSLLDFLFHPGGTNPWGSGGGNVWSGTGGVPDLADQYGQNLRQAPAGIYATEEALARGETPDDVFVKPFVQAWSNPNKYASESPLWMTADVAGAYGALKGGLGAARDFLETPHNPVREVRATPPGPYRDVQAEQAGRGGLSDLAEAAAQDDFAARLATAAREHAPERIRGTDPRLSSIVDRIGRGYRPNEGARVNTPSETGLRQFVHETDVRNVPSIRERGIEARWDPAEEGRRFVSAREAGASMSDVPRGRARIRFGSEEEPVRRPNVNTVKFPKDVKPETIVGVDYAPRNGPRITRSRSPQQR